MRKTCLETVRELALKDERIVFLGSDLGVGTMDELRREAPDRVLREGICEQNVVGMAAGLALEGRIVYVNTIASFLTRRAFEQATLDLCLHRARVRLIGNGGGLVYAPLGPTHLAFEDLSIFRALPNMTILAPADAEEMRAIIPQTVDIPGPVYIRLGKGYDPIVTTGGPECVIGKGRPMRRGSDLLMLTTGVTVGPCLDAADLLAGQGIEASVLHLPTVKPLDRDMILDLAASVRAVLSVEENTIIGGLGSAAAEILMEAGFSGLKFKRLGLPDVFPDQYGSQAGLMRRFGLDPESIAAAAEGLL